MAGATPTISIASVPGGQIGVSEAGLPNGTQAGQARTSGSWTFTISAPDGVDDLTVGGYRAITDGVFTAGSAAFGPGILAVTAYDPADGSVTVSYEITSPYESPYAGPQQRYGDFLSAPIVLSDRDGDQAQASLGIQIRDDETLTLSQDSAAVTAGAAASGNVVTGGTPDRFTADGFGGVSRAGTDTGGAINAMPERGVLTVEGLYGTLTLDRWGGYTYTAKADASGVDHFQYWATDGDGDEASSWLHVTVQPGGGSSPADGRTITAPGPNSSLNGGSGADTINASQGGDTIATGGGADVIVMATTPWSPHVITDFALGTDKLDFQPLTGAYTGSDPVRDKYIVFLDDGAGGTKVLYDSDGEGTAQQQWPTYVAHLQGVSSQGLSWSQLTGVANDGDGGGGEDDGSGETIVSPAPNSTLTGGDGADTITASRGGDVITGGDGSDLFVFETDPWSPHVLRDFRVGEDKVDLSTLLRDAGYGGSDPVADKYVWLQDDGAGGLNILFDSDGTGPDPEWPNFLAKLDGVSAATTTWAQLTGGGTGGTTEPPPPPPPTGGGQTITSTGPGSTLTGGSGADTLISSRGQDVLTGGGGADHFVFAAENWAPARITDFEDGVDKIDIRGMLDAVGYTGSNPFADGYLSLIDDGAGGTKVLFDRDAAGTAQQWPNYVFQVEKVAPSTLGASDWIFQ